MRRTRSGLSSAHLPVMPKLACTLSRDSVSSICCANPRSAPASKVSATVRDVVGPRLITTAGLVEGTAVGAGATVAVGGTPVGGTGVAVGADVACDAGAVAVAGASVAVEAVGDERLPSPSLQARSRASVATATDAWTAQR